LFVQSITAAVLGTEFGKYTSGVLPSHVAIGVLVVICVFVAGFAWSWGPLGWLVPSEIQTMETRAAGMSVAVTVNFLFSFIIGQVFLSMLCTMKWGVFLFFAGWVVIMSLFIFFFLPETKNVPVEQVHVLFARHPLWGRFMGSSAQRVIDHSDERIEAKKARGVFNGNGDDAFTTNGGINGTKGVATSNGAHNVAASGVVNNGITDNGRHVSVDRVSDN